ncbi:hypothetical protein [Streptomyces sp. RerS4]|uniref:hypothetical protein n=1 Tax=Streptomyces sp. RerS4 TaxID=2942449 RepID=UPI00201BAD74|nr:hypothetical protein [Streptomyces sp. RerS4]UQX04803.1 hypothetical protein M4D82_01645 [Streptomyces sp. RerS4]
MRALATELGWAWKGTPDSPVLITGRPSGDARLRPVGTYEERYVDGESYVELAVPVAIAASDAAAQAAAFRAAREEITAALGKPSVIGSHGDLGPFYDSGQLWGTPFVRWRGRPDTLELRAGTSGPELVLQPTDPAENWFWRQGVGEEHSISGFFGTNRDPANVGLGFPGGWSARSWETVTRSLGDFLGALPAETTALGIGVSMPLYGRDGRSAPLLFDVVCRDRLSIACFAPDEVDPAALGWGTVDRYPGTAATFGDGDPMWRVDAGGPGEPKGRALADMLVATARAAGVSEPTDLIVGGEAAYVGDYHVTYYGLGLPTG